MNKKKLSKIQDLNKTTYMGKWRWLAIVAFFAVLSGCERAAELVSQGPWATVDKAISVIAPDDKQVVELLSLARTSQRHWDPASPFYAKFSTYYDEQYLEYVDVNSDEAIPSGVFMALMYGSHRLYKFDWKSIYNPESLRYIFNLALQANQLEVLDAAEFERLFKLADASQAQTELEAKAEKMVSILESIISARNRRILWINGGGDYYEFFIVQAAVAESLNTVHLNEELVFLSPLN